MTSTTTASLRANYCPPPPVYSPKTPEHPDDDKPLDFSKSSLPADDEAKYLKSDCFTTPSPSPPERNHTFLASKNHLDPANLLQRANHFFGKLMDGPNSHLLKHALHLASLTSEPEAVNQIFSTLMQNGEQFDLMQNLAKSEAAISPIKHTSPLKNIPPTSTATVTVANSHPYSPPAYLLSSQATTFAPHVPLANPVLNNNSPNGGLLTTANFSSENLLTPIDITTLKTSPRRATYPSRPFKALYGKDVLTPAAAQIPLPLTPETLATQNILLSNSDKAYQEFRKQTLLSKRSNTSGGRSNRHKSPSSSSHSNGDPHSDDNNSNGSNSSSGEGEAGRNGETAYSRATSLMSMVTSSPVTPIFTSSNSSTSSLTAVTSSQPGGTPTSGQTGVRKRGRPLPDDLKDEAYWERRRKNNEAAKRSRDLRRAKEDEIAIRAAFLEQENFRLKLELIQAKTDFDKMKALWLGSQQGQKHSNEDKLCPGI